MSGLKKVIQAGLMKIFYLISRNLRTINLAIISPIAVPLVK